MKIKPANVMLFDAMDSELQSLMDYIERNKINRQVCATINFPRNKRLLEEALYKINDRYNPPDNLQYIISW